MSAPPDPWLRWHKALCWLHRDGLECDCGLDAARAADAERHQQTEERAIAAEQQAFMLATRIEQERKDAATLRATVDQQQARITELEQQVRDWECTLVAELKQSAESYYQTMTEREFRIMKLETALRGIAVGCSSRSDWASTVCGKCVACIARQALETP